MPRRVSILALAALLAFAGFRVASAQHAPPALADAPALASPAGPKGPLQAQAPSNAEMQERAKKLIANQHRDDAALEQYERIERHLDRTGGANPRTIEEKTFRIVPNGIGETKLLLKEGGRPTDPTEHRRQLQGLTSLLELALKPDDPRTKTANTKWQKRKRDRADLVDAAGDAFLRKWQGRETLNGYDCDVIELDPNPSFHPRSLLQDVLTHATAKIWVDHGSDQLVRGEAYMTRDFSVGAGILGKLYRGGVFSIEQAEVAPGIWLPTRYQFDFTGRKFIFTFEEHQLIEASQFRRVGPPKQTLAQVQNELASGKVAGDDP
jgi:hypothetical protein